MTTPVLLVSIGRGWFAAARIPRALALAGFEVSALVPPNSLVQHSGHVTHLEFLPSEPTTLEWVRAFASVVGKRRPHIVIPCEIMPSCCCRASPSSRLRE